MHAAPAGAAHRGINPQSTVPFLLARNIRRPTAPGGGNLSRRLFAVINHSSAGAVCFFTNQLFIVANNGVPSYWWLGITVGLVTAAVMYVADSFPDEVREEKQETPNPDLGAKK
jgi:hypothetical protein